MTESRTAFHTPVPRIQINLEGSEEHHHESFICTLGYASVQAWLWRFRMSGMGQNGTEVSTGEFSLTWTGPNWTKQHGLSTLSLSKPHTKGVPKQNQNTSAFTPRPDRVRITASKTGALSLGCPE